MIFWNIECLEVIVVKLYLWSLCNIKSHTDEDLFQLIENDGDWMFFAQNAAFARHGNIQCLGCKALIQKVKEWRNFYALYFPNADYWFSGCFCNQFIISTCAV